MYLQHFGLRELPFTLTPNTQFFCDLPGHREALNVLLVALAGGEGFIKITGEVGSGKTLLCRLLLNSLHGKQPYAYVANANLEPPALQRALASELGLPDTLATAELPRAIERQLLALARAGHPVVLIIDEAQALPDSSLESLRLFTNLETERGKLLQVVLFGQPELDTRLARPQLRQLRQRIAFSYCLPRLSLRQSNRYLQHRLDHAGWQHGRGFSRPAQAALHFFAVGTPRVLNLLSHKCLMLAYAGQRYRLRLRDVLHAASDTEATRPLQRALRQCLLLAAGLLSAGLALAFWTQP
ncbi:AAA family ATPase [Permianibacter sp. IMCC34836]|uniref:ExeA family protein n=1 Tax=Permianibacter fluminis TaxID=2738515 RepID=UPI001552FCDC|nr:AAA family ATPase [Permianibacter fluminis]NQD37298.1 AAA family ATPase [Permianibacter fluminis]